MQVVSHSLFSISFFSFSFSFLLCLNLHLNPYFVLFYVRCCLYTSASFLSWFYFASFFRPLKNFANLIYLSLYILKLRSFLAGERMKQNKTRKGKKQKYTDNNAH